MKQKIGFRERSTHIQSIDFWWRCKRQSEPQDRLHGCFVLIYLLIKRSFGKYLHVGEGRDRTIKQSGIKDPFSWIISGTETTTWTGNRKTKGYVQKVNSTALLSAPPFFTADEVLMTLFFPYSPLGRPNTFQSKPQTQSSGSSSTSQIQPWSHLSPKWFLSRHHLCHLLRDWSFNFYAKRTLVSSLVYWLVSFQKLQTQTSLSHEKGCGS